MDRWEKVINLLMDLRDVTYKMLSKSVKPFYILQWISVDQREDVLDPLMDLRDATYQMLFESIQPFYIVFWCFQMLLLSCRGELRSQSVPNCLLHYHELVCAGCHHLDSSTFAGHADQTFILKELMVECIRTAFSITAYYYYPYVFLTDYFTILHHRI